jgi:hypothetical protein
MGGASTTIASRFKSIMDSFLDASGGEVNNIKCQIFSWNISPRALREIAQVLQFPTTENWSSFKYLGIPITLKYSHSQVWQQILEKISKKITNWGTQWLNPTAWVILIKVVLSTLPIYQSSSLLAPKCIANQMAKRIHTFLWKGGKTAQKKFHLVNWNQVT